MKIELDVNSEQFDEAVFIELLSIRDCLKDDLKKREAGGTAIFENDLDKDVKLLKESIAAFGVVAGYFSG